MFNNKNPISLNIEISVRILYVKSNPDNSLSSIVVLFYNSFSTVMLSSVKTLQVLGFP